MKFALLLFVLTIPSWSASLQTQPKAEEVAKQSADAWLALVDAGKYADSWGDAAQLFKMQVSKKQWETAARAARSPLGNLQSRKLKSTTYKTSLPGMPDGQYVVLQYESSFEHKQSAIETVALLLDKDGIWRVSGYYIR
jgi:hypothetical protein